MYLIVLNQYIKYIYYSDLTINFKNLNEIIMPFKNKQFNHLTHLNNIRAASANIPESSTSHSLATITSTVTSIPNSDSTYDPLETDETNTLKTMFNNILENDATKRNLSVLIFSTLR